MAKKEDILGFSLVNREFISITDGVIMKTLELGEAYSHYSYVFPRYRGNKVFQRIKRYVYQEEFKKGAESILSVVDITNKPSIRAQLHLGVKIKRFVWIVHGMELKQANQGKDKPTRISSRMVFDDELAYLPLSILGRLDMAYHQLKKKIKKMMKG